MNIVLQRISQGDRFVRAFAKRGGGTVVVLENAERQFTAHNVREDVDAVEDRLVRHEITCMWGGRPGQPVLEAV